jgi:K+-transporting ATPase KdpF subunit
MSGFDLIGVVLAFAVGVYLLLAMLRPEEF